MAGRTIEIACSDAKSHGGRFTGLLSLPPAGKGPGIVLMSEVFGVTGAVAELASGYAEQGYVVLVPDMFWRAGEMLTFGYDARRDAGDAFLLAGGSVGHKQNFIAAAEALKSLPECAGGIAAVGFGVGALTAFAAAAGNLVDGAVSFYPAILPLGDAANMETPWQYHYAEADIFPRDNLFNDVVDMVSRRNGVDIRSYAGAGYGFAMPGAPA